jgi:hypothetical protein
MIQQLIRSHLFFYSGCIIPETTNPIIMRFIEKTIKLLKIVWVIFIKCWGEINDKGFFISLCFDFGPLSQ